MHIQSYTTTSPDPLKEEGEQRNQTKFTEKRFSSPLSNVLGSHSRGISSLLSPALEAAEINGSGGDGYDDDGISGSFAYKK